MNRCEDATLQILEILFELLKVYLMLGRPDKLDARIAATWIQKDWEQSLALDPHAQAQFRAHVNNLLELKGSYEPIRLDGELITMVRRTLTAIPSALQLYADFKNETLADHARDFRLQDMLGPRAPQVFGPTVQTLMIPGLYTYDGYSAIFQTQVFAFIEARLKRNWILENPQVDQSHDVRLLYDDLQALYFRDYTKAWRHLLESLRVKQPQGVHEAIQILDLLSGRDAPFLKTLLVAVERNTSLTRAPTIDSSDKRQGQENDAERKRSLETAQRAWQNDSQPPPARDLERHFEDLNTLVRSTGNSPPPLENILRLLSEVRGSLLQSSNDTRNEAEAQRIVKGQTSAASASDVFSKAEMEFRLLPEPLKSWLLSFTTFGQQADREGIAKAVKSNLEARKSELNAIWKKDVLHPCSTGLDGRYPLVPHSQTDATIADFSRFFAPNGHIERFFHSHLQPFVDTTAPRWQQVSMEKHTIGLSAELLQQLQYAERIRKTFFATGGSTPSVQFELEPIALDANASSFELNIEGEAAEYAHGPIRPKTFRWPGPQPDAGVRLLFKPLVGNSVSKSSSGPWAWLRTLDKAIVKKPGLNDRFLVTFQVESYKADYELRAMSVDNPFQLKELQSLSLSGVSVMSARNVPGLYGKLPILGDFLSRRLPARFVQTWDTWLQEALSTSRKQLGAEWLEIYLYSPIWRFILSPGNCGPTAWAGILMPSVDKVNRYFPFTLAVSINEQNAYPSLFVAAAPWFDKLEQLALSALEDNVNLDEFDRHLQEQTLDISYADTWQACFQRRSCGDQEQHRLSCRNGKCGTDSRGLSATQRWSACQIPTRTQPVDDKWFRADEPCLPGVMTVCLQ